MLFNITTLWQAVCKCLYLVTRSIIMYANLLKLKIVIELRFNI